MLSPTLAVEALYAAPYGNRRVGPAEGMENSYQDLPAARVVFDSGVPVVHIPCANVSEHLKTTLPEVERYVRGRGAIGDYLYELYLGHAPDHFARSKEIWDISAIAYCSTPPGC